MPTIIECPNCGKETYKEIPACPHCKHPFRPADAESTPHTETNFPTDTELFLKTTEAAFEYAVRFLPGEFATGNKLYGIIDEVPEEVHDNSLWGVRLAAGGGAIPIKSCGNIANSMRRHLNLPEQVYKAGDLVVIEISRYDTAFPITSPMQYFIIMGRLLPILLEHGRVFKPDI